MYKLNVSDDLTEVLMQIQSILSRRDVEISNLHLRLDFQNSRFVDPTILGVIAAFVEKLKLRHDVSVECHGVNSDTSDYISRMNFFREVGVDYEEWFSRRDERGRFIPIKRISETNRYSIPKEISTIISSQWGGIDNSIVAALDWSVSEIIDNVFNHSQTKIDGFVVAQYYANKNKIDIIIVDGGIGIPRRLRQNPEYKGLEATELLNIAVEKDVTVNPETNKGAGLFYTKRIIEENRGLLRINSDKGQLLVMNGRKRVTEAPKWTGTIVKLRIRTDIVIRPEDVWEDNIPVTVGDYMETGTLW